MKIRITPGAVLLFSVMLFHRDPLFPATLIAATVHECGHLLAASALGVRLRLLELDVIGARLYPAGALPSYRSELALAAAGPLFSLLLATVTFPLSGNLSRAVFGATCSLALFNLLPIGGFDGWRILNGVLSPLFGEGSAAKALHVCSYLSIFALFCFSSALLLRYGESLSLTVLCASLFARTFLQQSPEKGTPTIN